MSAYKWITTGLKNLRISGQGSTIPGSQTQARYLVNTAVTSKDSNVPSPVEIPPRPKRPLSPFFQFLGSYRSQVRAKYPKLRVTEVMQILSKKWKELPQDEKDPYIKVFASEMEKYSKIKEAYDQSLTMEQQSTLQQLKLDRQVSKEKRQHKKRVRDSGKPTKPPSAYLRFLKENFPKGMASREEVIKACKSVAGQWQTLTLEEKQPYVDAYLIDRESYDIILKRWEKQMLREGKDDLVRNATIEENLEKQRKRK